MRRPKRVGIVPLITPTCTIFVCRPTVYTVGAIPTYHRNPKPRTRQQSARPTQHFRQKQLVEYTTAHVAYHRLLNYSTPRPQSPPVTASPPPTPSIYPLLKFSPPPLNPPPPAHPAPLPPLPSTRFIADPVLARTLSGFYCTRSWSENKPSTL